MENIIKDIIRGVSNTYGQAFFEQICLALDYAVKADYTFIASLKPQMYEAQTLALVANGKLVDNISYSLKDTPCAGVLERQSCCYPADVCHHFPNDPMLIDMQIAGYLGTAIHDSNGKVMGIVVALYKRPIHAPDTTQTLFELFSGRISGEMERLQYQEQLQRLNASLEKRVEERTNALQDAIAHLKEAQEQLIESEKMAALGNLVAGVAHEVNTPLGVAITSASVVQDSLNTFWQTLHSGKMRRSEVEMVEQRTMEAMTLLSNNLARAKELVTSFKQTAADQQSLVLEELKLMDYYQNILHLLSPKTQLKQIHVVLKGQVSRPVLTFPGAHAQILTNLINNSINHGFAEPKAQPEIKIGLSEQEGQVVIHYQDNGRGLSEHERLHIFEPFFTTDRKAGNVGLGMSILFNLVTQKLKGQLQLDPPGEGFGIRIQLPLLC
ncbi:sensor histidine kinase [Bowmanella pacifica]|uniref:histidine kinase n=1 Tax=Bowmanella pacifica TaxID=502051 RepID=A0A917Z2I8_9ALTE|nr:HAMP domain-containing sensor histidine kinase [Bowmanella pacifica]GGO72605.1 hypothetical protein GCM10010982_31130 [Bowmanella pacifica]